MPMRLDFGARVALGATLASYTICRGLRRSIYLALVRSCALILTQPGPSQRSFPVDGVILDVIFKILNLLSMDKKPVVKP